ncbi:MAG: class I SAM-dependent methyltransferase [Chloroflexota bacterium]
MIQRPELMSQHNAEAFHGEDVVTSYQFRPDYADETFAILAALLNGNPRRILDAGCGRGDIARPLVASGDEIEGYEIEGVDAVDFSAAMIAHGQQMPNGDHPNLRWHHGRIEEVPLDPPYGLIIAAASLHWMDWPVVMPRFRELLVPGGYLAVVNQRTTPDAWSLLDGVIDEYRVDGTFEPFDLFGELERHHLFKPVGKQQTASLPFVQSIEDAVESYHSRTGFARTRMGKAKATAFDQAAREVLYAKYPSGIVQFEVAVSILWGLPGE